jgi:hypothetical protein
MLLTNPKNCDQIESPLSDNDAIIILRDIATHPIAQHMSDNTRAFATSIYSQWKRYSRMSDSQRFWAHKIILDARAAANRALLPRETVQLGHEFASIISLFDHAKSALKRPKIRFEIPAIGEIRLSVAGPNSRSPGSINVTDAGSYGSNTWYGRVTRDGEFILNPRCDTLQAKTIAEFLRLFAKNPSLLASTYGRKTGNCCFCGRFLTDERSVYVGYGPVCAEHFSMPYGERPPHDHQDSAAIEALLAQHEESAVPA